MVDLGYFVLGAFAEIADKDAYFLSRYMVHTKSYTPNGAEINLLDTLRSANTSSLDIDVCLGAKQRLPCRLIVLRVPQEVADQRRRKAIKNAKRKGRTLGKVTLALMDWAIFVSNVPSEMLCIPCFSHVDSI